MPAPTSQPSTTTQTTETQNDPFARLGRWLDMFDEIRATDPRPIQN